MHHHDGQQQRAFQVRIPLRTVTPLFLAGADPRGPAELRAASVRGALRFWLRALAGGCYGTDDAGLQEVWRLEARVFGDAGGKDGFGASKVVVTLDGGAVQPLEWRPIRQSQKRRADRETGSGIDYLYWSMEATSKEQPRWYFAPDTVFDLNLSPRYRRTYRDELSKRREDDMTDSEALDHALRAAWLLITLGALGARQRRTAGSLVARQTRVEGYPNYDFVLPSNLEAAKARIGSHLSRFRRDLGRQADFDTAALPSFEVLHPQFCHIWILGLWKSWQEATEEIGHKLQIYRRRLPIQHRWVFGLPLPRVTVTFGVSDDEVKRRSSPLWLKLSRSEDGKILGLATVFEARPLPAGAVIRQTGKHPGARPTVYRIVEDFIHQQFPNAVEVRYE